MKDFKLAIGFKKNGEVLDSLAKCQLIAASELDRGTRSGFLNEFVGTVGAEPHL